MNQVVSLSEGKDSLAMLLGLIERREPIHSVVHVTTGWEFPFAAEHIARVQVLLASADIPFVHFNISKYLRHLMFDHAVFRRKEPQKGKLYSIGKGWPSPSKRWCTTRKNEVKDKYTKAISEPASCIGYAKGEEHRIESENIKKSSCATRFPLIEWGMTEEDALAYCREHGFYSLGESPYDHFARVSCFCCPLQGLDSWRALRRYYPQQWGTILEWAGSIRTGNESGKSWWVGESEERIWCESTVYDLEARFAREDAIQAEEARRIHLPGVRVDAA